MIPDDDHRGSAATPQEEDRESGQGSHSHFEERGLVLRQVAAAVEIDVALLSKIELGQRLPTPEQTGKLGRVWIYSPANWRPGGSPKSSGGTTQAIRPRRTPL
jgi:hypothetical protein